MVEDTRNTLRPPQLFIITAVKQATPLDTTIPNNREGGHNLARNIKESIYIRVNNPTLNNNIGKFNLPHIWDRVLLNTKGLNLKRIGNNNNTKRN